MKKSWLFALSAIFLLLISFNFVSSQSLSELLNELDQSTILLFAIFIIAFLIVFFALNKVFKKENTAISGIISVVLAFLITFGISRTGFDLEYSLLSIGVSSEVLGIIIPLIIVGGIIFLIIKLRRDSLLVIGGLFLFAGILGLVYAYLVFIVIGAILIIVRIFIPKGLWKRPLRTKI